MSMIIEFRGDCFMFPGKWVRLDLDSQRDRETFENIDWTSAAMHLYDGQEIVIRCVKRVD